MSDPLLNALLTATRVLEEADIPYAITGSFAAAHHGHVRATEDVDIAVHVAALEELEAVADTLPAGVRRVDLTTWDLPGDVLVELYPLGDDLDRVALEGREEGVLVHDDEVRIWFVPLEALLVLKVREHVRHGHGLKHIADVQALLTRNADTLDVAELERLLAFDPAWGEAWDALVEPA